MADNHILFYGMLAVLLGLCIVRYAFQINIPLIGLLVLAVLIAMFSNIDEIIALCVCMIPLITSIQHNYVLMFCILCYLARYRKLVNVDLTIVPVLLMILWELFHGFDGIFSPVDFVCMFLPQVVIALMMFSGKHEFDYDFVVHSYALSVFGMCVSLLGRVFYASGFDFAAVLVNLQRLGMDLKTTTNLEIVGGQQNPNTLGIQCVLAVTGLIQIRNAGRKHRSDLVIMIGLLVFGALTSSRTYIACLVAMFGLFILSKKGSAVDKLKIVGWAILLVAVMVLLLYLIFPDVLTYYISRFFAEDITTGRDRLMLLYHEFIVSNPKVLLLGIGLQDYKNQLINVHRVAENVPHNALQELIIAWGIPGVILFSAWIIAMIVTSKKRCKQQGLINYIPLLIILFKGMAGQMLNSAYTMLAFSYAYLSMCADLSPRDEQRIFTRTQTIPRGSGHNINQSSERTKKR